MSQRIMIYVLLSVGSLFITGARCETTGGSLPGDVPDGDLGSAPQGEDTEGNRDDQDISPLRPDFLPDIDEACGTADALSTCLSPKIAFVAPEAANGKSRYEAASVRYFLTMKTNQRDTAPIFTGADDRVGDYKRPLEDGEWNPVNRWFRKTTIHPRYASRVIRFEFPPWLLTTGYGAATMKYVDELLRIYQTDYEAIDCRFFPTQPFGRCRVVFLYGKDDPSTDEDERTPCPIYEEFTFNDQGQVTFIEAWTDHEDYLPMDPGDPWAEGEGVKRLSTWIPGLGNATGRIDPKSEAFKRAAAAFDAAFDAPYWSKENHPVGPFTSMMDDIKNGTVLSFWPNWFQRAAEHMASGDPLGGCRPE